jgi:hypothetical protein
MPAIKRGYILNETGDIKANNNFVTDINSMFTVPYLM